MLREWLQSSPNPTWSVLVKALRSSSINRFDIAAKIEDKYIKSDDKSEESKDTAGEQCDYRIAGNFRVGKSFVELEQRLVS